MENSKYHDFFVNLRIKKMRILSYKLICKNEMKENYNKLLIIYIYQEVRPSARFPYQPALFIGGCSFFFKFCYFTEKLITIPCEKKGYILWKWRHNTPIDVVTNYVITPYFMSQFHIFREVYVPISHRDIYIVFLS